MKNDDLDDVENGAVAQGVADQAAAQEEPKDEDDDLAAETELARKDGEEDSEDDGTQPPADVEQQPDGEPKAEGDVEPPAEEPKVETVPPRARRVYLEHDLSFMIPPGAAMIGDEMQVADNDPTRAFIEIEGEGPDVTVSFDDIWDEHHGTRRVISWK